jgi:beta-phosphoglucomutase-like phosphatase (HAD superfamily)
MTRVEVLLCDADGNLFPSEEPAFEASAAVTNRYLATIGVPKRFTPEQLRSEALGRNFRSISSELASAHGVPVGDAELEWYVAQERREVTAHLARTLSPDPAVSEPLRRIAARVPLAAVSSSASGRLDACFRATGLDELIPSDRRFSAEDSLPVPAGKPDPAIYAHACEALGVAPDAALAVEDAPAGVRSAVGAGVPTVGNLVFVAEAERAEREAELRAAGASRVVSSWVEVEELLGS